MSNLSPALFSLAAAVVGAIVTWLVGRYGRKGARENDLINQLQEERDADRARIDQLSTQVAAISERLTRLETENRALRGRDVLWKYHTALLESCITGLGGTPPDRPADLREDLS